MPSPLAPGTAQRGWQAPPNEASSPLAGSRRPETASERVRGRQKLETYTTTQEIIDLLRQLGLLI